MTTALDDREVREGTKEILLWTTSGVTQARYAAGEWHDYLEGREYDGPVWVCCDDHWQIEIEECSKNRREWYHGEAKYWQELPEKPDFSDWPEAPDHA